MVENRASLPAAIASGERTLAQAIVERVGTPLELVEPGKHAGGGAVEVGQHAVVVVARERDVL